MPAIRLLPILLMLLALASGAAKAQAEAPEPTYGQQVGAKAARSLVNIPLSILEIPKNVINTSNQTNVAFGLTGGLLKGIVMGVGRIATGVLEFVTLPLPTRPIVHPVYPWEDYFDIDTSFGPSFDVVEQK